MALLGHTQKRFYIVTANIALGEVAKIDSFISASNI